MFYSIITAILTKWFNRTFLNTSLKKIIIVCLVSSLIINVETIKSFKTGVTRLKVSGCFYFPCVCVYTHQNWTCCKCNVILSFYILESKGVPFKVTPKLPLSHSLTHWHCNNFKPSSGPVSANAVTTNTRSVVRQHMLTNDHTGFLKPLIRSGNLSPKSYWQLTYCRNWLRRAPSRWEWTNSSICQWSRWNRCLIFFPVILQDTFSERGFNDAMHPHKIWTWCIL